MRVFLVFQHGMDWDAVYHSTHSSWYGAARAAVIAHREEFGTATSWQRCAYDGYESVNPVSSHWYVKAVEVQK